MNALMLFVWLGLGSALIGVGYRIANGRVEYGTLDEGKGSQSHGIDGADAASFEVLPDGNYAKDSRSAYWMGLRIQDAEASSFQSISKYHAKDSQHAYFSQLVIPGADPATFVELTLQLAKDKSHAYDGWASYGLCDASTFHVLGGPGNWSVDSKCGYFARMVVAGADPATFSVVAGRLSEFATEVS
jgi:DKNYY family